MTHSCQFKGIEQDDVHNSLFWGFHEDDNECCGAIAHFKIEMKCKCDDEVECNCPQSVFLCAKHYDAWYALFDNASDVLDVTRRVDDDGSLIWDTE